MTKRIHPRHSAARGVSALLMLLLLGASCTQVAAASHDKSPVKALSPTATSTKKATGPGAQDDDSPHYTTYYPDSPQNGGTYVVEGTGMPGDKLIARLSTKKIDQSGDTLLSVSPCKNARVEGNNRIIDVDARGIFTCQIDSRNEDDAADVVHTMTLGVVDAPSLKNTDVKSVFNDVVTVDYKVKKYPVPKGTFTVDTPSAGKINVPAKIAGKGYPGADVVVATSSITNLYCVAKVSAQGRWECPGQLDVDYTQGDGPSQLSAASYLDGYQNNELQQPEEVINREFTLPSLQFSFTNPDVASDIQHATPVEAERLPDTFAIAGSTTFQADTTPIEVNVFRLKDGQDASNEDNWEWLYDCYANRTSGKAWSCDQSKYPFNLKEYGSGYYAFSAYYPEYAFTQIMTYMRLFKAPRITSPKSSAVITTEEMAIEGSGEAGDKITVTATSNSGEIPMCTATTNAQNQWDCRASTPPDDGGYGLSAKQTRDGKAEGSYKTVFIVKHDNDDDDEDEKPRDPWNPDDIDQPPPPGPPDQSHQHGCDTCAGKRGGGGGGGGGPYGGCKLGGKLLPTGMCRTPKDGNCPDGYTKSGNSCKGPPDKPKDPKDPPICPSGYTYNPFSLMCEGPIPGGPDFVIIEPLNQTPLPCGDICQSAVAGTIPAGDTARVTVFDTDWNPLSGPYTSQVDGAATRWVVPTVVYKRNATLNIIAVRMHNGQAVPGVYATQLTRITTPALSVDSPTEGQTLTVGAGNIIGLSGHAMPGSTVKITNDLTCSAVADKDGQWACQTKVSLPVRQSYSINVTDYDASNHVIGGPIQRRFYVRKYVLTVDAPSEGQAFNLSDSIRYAGQAAPGLVVNVQGDIGCTATADSTARWSCGPYSLGKLATGNHTLTVSTADDPSITRTFSVHKANELTVDTPAEGEAIYYKSDVTFSGQAAPGNVVTVQGFINCTAVANSSARWSCGPYPVGNPPGLRTVTVSTPGDVPVTRTFYVSRL